MKTTEHVYRIRDKHTGLFSSGGSAPNWSKKGRVWRGSGPLRNHLSMFVRTWPRMQINIPDEWEIVTYELVETETGTTSAAEFYSTKKK